MRVVALGDVAVLMPVSLMPDWVESTCPLLPACSAVVAEAPKPGAAAAAAAADGVSAAVAAALASDLLSE